MDRSALRPEHSPSGALPAHMTIGDYLVRRLMHHDVRHVFGIPGDYVLGFYDRLADSRLEVVGTCQEDGAGFAADAYARVKGIGCCCITYCVGGLSVANAIAGAYAEKSPVVVISGAPGVNERMQDPMLHHKVRSFDSQLKVFREITAAAVALEEPDAAYRTIDEVLATCVATKRPVYLEIPRDLVDVVPQHRMRGERTQPRSDPAALDEAVNEIAERLRAASDPVVLAGVEVHRHGMQRPLLELIENGGLPVAATLLGKSVISERHPHYLGVYEGAMGRDAVTRRVEDSDCLLMLGTFMTDVNLGVFTAELERGRSIRATSEAVHVGHHRYVNVRFEDLMTRLARLDLPQRDPGVDAPQLPALGEPDDAPLAVSRLFARLNDLLSDDMAVVCDVGLSLFGAADLVIHRRTEFIAPAYYTSMGFAVPAAIGVGFADRKLRPVVLVGDGAFHMTGMELATAARYGLDPIVLVLDNRGYTTERVIHEGPYNDVHPWNFDRIPEVLGAGRAWRVTNERELLDAWQQAVANRESYSLLHCHLDPADTCPALQRLGERLGKRV